MRAVFRPEARQELLAAWVWYEARAKGLGFEFARAVDVAISKALRMPLASPRIEAEFRQITLRRFPYFVIYLPGESELIVVACFHHRREPRSWVSRVTS